MPAPFVLSSDLVSAYPAKSVTLADYIDTSLAAKTDTAMVQNAQTGVSYSFALADASKLLTTSNASPVSVTVTKQATVTWVTGTQLRVMNLGAGVTTLVADTGVTINGNKALSQYQGGTLIRTASDAWTFLPNSSYPANASARVDTSQTTTSTTYTDLATVGPSVTVTTGTKALVMLAGQATNSLATANSADIAFAVSGATTIAASQENKIFMNQSTAGYGLQVGSSLILTGLTAGSNTFTLKYRATAAGTASFAYRVISVVDMGS